MLTPLSDHQLSVLFIQLAGLLLAARGLGALSRRLGQPAVVGELLAGLVLGPSVFGKLWPYGFRQFLPSRPSGVEDPLLTVAQISLVVLLVAIGEETDLKLIRRLGGAAASVSVMSIALPFAAGMVLASFLPSSLIGRHGVRVDFELLMAGAVAVSSLPVIAKIVGDMGMARRNFGQLIFAAGTVNDVFGFIVVAVVAALVGSRGGAGAAHLIRVLGALVLVTVLVAGPGRRLVDRLLRRVLAGPNPRPAGLSVALTGALIVTGLFQELGIEGVLGAFLFGLVLGRSRFQQSEVRSGVASLSSAVFAPLYFATAGLRVDVSDLSSRPVLISFLALVTVALVMKLAGGVVGGALARLPKREWLALGVGLNGRGALQVILGSTGLSLGVLSNGAYSDIILMSLVTSVMTAPLLRLAVRNWEGTEDEQARLGFEEEMAGNIVVRGQRLLIPSRGSPNSIVAAELLGAVWPEASEVTLLSIGQTPEGVEPDLEPVAAVLEPRGIEKRHVSSDDVLDQILAEARLGYGVIGVGAAERPSAEGLLSPVIDDLLGRTPIPLVVVRRAHGLRRATPPAFATALVPVTGSPASRAGEEVAYNLSRNLGTGITLVHVVTRVEVEPRPRQRRSSRTASGAGEGVLAGAELHAREMGVEVQSVRPEGQAAGEEILGVAQEREVDVIIAGATVREVDGQPFLGHTIEHLLENADATVVVVVLPDPSRTSETTPVAQEGAGAI